MKRLPNTTTHTFLVPLSSEETRVDYIESVRWRCI